MAGLAASLSLTETQVKYWIKFNTIVTICDIKFKTSVY